MRFTIVTPSFNQLDWLRLCVASVRDQVVGKAEKLKIRETESEGGPCSCRGECISVEHIVQDAGSEGIEEFAREHGAAFYRDGKEVFREQDSGDRGQETRDRGGDVGDHLLKIYSERDAGMYDAINKGLKRASGDICAYLNCDEQYLPGTLRWVADYFMHSTKVDVLFGAAIVTRADGSYVCDRRVMVPTRWHTMVSGNLSIFTSSTFFRRESVVDRGLLFDPQWRVCGDAVWALRFIEAGLNMDASHQPLSCFAETGANLSAAGNRRAEEEACRLARSAPGAARALKPLVLLVYRLRRWWSGAYALKPHSYSIYTTSDAQRRRFDVSRPTFRWQMTAGPEQVP